MVENNVTNLTSFLPGNNGTAADIPDLEEFCSGHENRTNVIKLPQCYDLKRSKQSQALSSVLVVCLVVIMFSMGCTVDVQKLKNRIVRPWGIMIGFLCQFGIMPLCAFALAKLFQLSQGKALVVLIMGCLPGGTVSNLMTYWCKGDLDLSIAMTTMSTIMGFAMMPLCLFAYGRFFFAGSVSIPYLTIAGVLGTFIVPIAVGILLKHFKPNIADKLAKIGAVVGVIVVVAAAVVGIVVYPSAYNIPTVFWLIAFILPLLGYILGYVITFALSKIIKNSDITQKQMRTVAIETGTQNVQLCSTITQLNYGCTCLILEMFAYPLVYFMYQVIETLIICAAIQIFDHFLKPSARVENAQAARQDENSLDAAGSIILHPLDDAAAQRVDSNMNKSKNSVPDEN